MSFHFCYFAHFCSFLCILTNPAPEIPLLLFINIRQFPCFETMGRFSLSPCEKECALAHSRAEARLLQQPSTTAPSAHPREAFIIVWKRSFQYDEKTAVHSCTAVSLFLILLIPGSKGLSPHELAHRWVKDLVTLASFYFAYLLQPS